MFAPIPFRYPVAGADLVQHTVSQDANKSQYISTAMTSYSSPPYSNLPYSNLVELLRDRALHQPEQIAYIFMEDGETESGRLTYQVLDRQARAIAAQLQTQVVPGSRALLVYPYTAGLEFIAAFLGCLYAGVIAVTDNPPRHAQSFVKLQNRVTSAQATMGLTTQTLLTQLKDQLDLEANPVPMLREIPWLATDTVLSDQASHWSQPDLSPDTLAFFQYTSGSTGHPKGVMVTHGNILHNERTIQTAFQHTEKTIVVGWLPMFHDMGLVGNVLQPLFIGTPSILMSPVSLIQKPVRWLQAISHYRATTSGGPNFAYDLLCQKVTPEQRSRLDLSSWELAFSGAEPIRVQTLERFAHLFGPCGFRRQAFYPCYGMAETTLFVTGGIKSAAPTIRHVDRAALEKNQVVPVIANTESSRAVVGCGQTWLGDKTIIVNPETLTQVSDDQVGEVWVTGAGVGQGYWGQSEETSRTFQAYLADTGEGPFLRTGDLGFMHEGELFITGRIKDLMILWGRNHYPQHIEQTVENSHAALRPNCGAAFAIENNEEEQLVVVHEVERHHLRQLAVDEVVNAIRKAVAEEHIAQVSAIVLLKTGTIPKTTSGKVQRQTCRSQFLAGSLHAVGSWQVEEGKNHSVIDSLVHADSSAPHS